MCFCVRICSVFHGLEYGDYTVIVSIIGKDYESCLSMFLCLSPFMLIFNRVYCLEHCQYNSRRGLGPGRKGERGKEWSDIKELTKKNKQKSGMLCNHLRCVVMSEDQKQNPESGGM